MLFISHTIYLIQLTISHRIILVNQNQMCLIRFFIFLWYHKPPFVSHESYLLKGELYEIFSHSHDLTRFAK